MRKTLQVVAILALCLPTHAAEPKAAGRSPEYQSLKIILDEKRPDYALRVDYPTEITLADEKEVTFSLTVVNLVKEDVFLAVKRMDFQHLGFQGDIHRDDEIVRSFGGGILFSSDEGLLKRLHACSYDKAGKPCPCGCCLGRIALRLDPESFETKALLSAEGTVDVRICGYLRANGEAFSKSVAIPIRVVKRATGVTKSTAENR